MVMRFRVLSGVLLAGVFGCMTVAASAQSAAHDDAGIISVSEACRQVERGPTVRQGVMTERLRDGVMTDRVRSERIITAALQ
jgi:hypothetical protein